MQNVKQALQEIESTLPPKEQGYFWTHSVRYYHILSQIQHIADGKKLIILDIGCFPYHVGKALESFGHIVYGISSYHEPIESKKIAILNIENEKFPFKDNFFSLVLCNEVIEHLPQSPIPMLKEIYRITQKNGHLMVTTPNIVRSINRGKMIMGKTIMYPLSNYFEENGKGNTLYHRHNREYTLEELSTLLQKTRWDIKEKSYFISYTPFRKRMILDSFPMFLGKYINYQLMRCIPSLQDTLFLLGTKR